MNPTQSEVKEKEHEVDPNDTGSFDQMNLISLIARHPKPIDTLDSMIEAIKLLASDESSEEKQQKPKIPKSKLEYYICGQGEKMEKLASLLTGFEMTPGSGCGLIFKGDLNSDEWIIEVKSTRSKHLRFDTAWWSKLKRQAKEKQKEKYALIFGWTDRPKDYDGSLQFVALPLLDANIPLWALEVKTKTKSLKLEHLAQLRDTGYGALVIKQNNSEEMISIVPYNIFHNTCIKQS